MSRASHLCCFQSRPTAPISFQYVLDHSFLSASLSFLTSSRPPPTPSIARTLATTWNHQVTLPHLSSCSLLSTQQSSCPSLPPPSNNLLFPLHFGHPTVPEIRICHPFTSTFYLLLRAHRLVSPSWYHLLIRPLAPMPTALPVQPFPSGLLVLTWSPMLPMAEAQDALKS